MNEINPPQSLRTTRSLVSNAHFHLSHLGGSMDYLEFQITLAIKLSLQVYKEEKYQEWAKNWLNKTDRSSKYAAYAAAYAADYAAYAAYAAADYAVYAAAASIKASLRAGAKLEDVITFKS